MIDEAHNLRDDAGRSKARPFLSTIGVGSPLFQEHPALILTLGYFSVSLVGMMFSWSLFQRFEINIFDYAEITDFLMAALREPMTFLLAAGGVLMAYAFFSWSEIERRYFERRPPKWRIARLYSRTSRWSSESPGMLILVIALYGYLFIGFYAQMQATSIRAGDGRHVQIVQEGYAADRSRLLLGTTSKLLFLFDAEAHSVEIVPYESLQSIRITAAKKAQDPVPTPGAATPGAGH